MKRNFLTFIVCLALTAAAALAQTRLTFEVASIKPSAPLDMAKMAADIQAGKMPKLGPHITAVRAEYIYVALRDLLVLAYKVKPYQISGPDWMTSQRFDIFAKIPDGASKEDVPKMLQALLEDRFKLTVHRDTKEHPVLALVVGKGGPKLKASPTSPEAVDENEPLKDNEMAVDGPDGQVRMTRGKDGEATVNMGKKGTMHYKMDPATQALRLEAHMVTMDGFADMLSQFSQMGGGGGRQIIDMTGLKGNYEVTLDIPLAELMKMAQAAGMDVGQAAGGASPGAGASAATAAAAATDPSTTATYLDTVQSLGLKLESRKAPVEQLIVDHVEKTATEN